MESHPCSAARSRSREACHGSTRHAGGGRFSSALLALALGLAAGGGCSEFQTATEGPGARAANEYIAAAEKVLASLQQVSDGATAREAVKTVGPQYEKLAKAKARVTTFRKGSAAQIRGRQDSVVAVLNEVEQYQTQIDLEFDRIETLGGVGMDFWGPVRRVRHLLRTAERRARSGGAGSEIDKAYSRILTIYQTISPEKIVEVEFSVPSGEELADLREKTLARFQQRLGEKVVVLNHAGRSGRGLACQVSPVSVNTVVAAVDFGEVVVRSDNSNRVTFRVSPKRVDPERWLPLPGQAIPGGWSAEMAAGYRETVRRYGRDRVVLAKLTNGDEAERRGLITDKLLAGMVGLPKGVESRRFEGVAGWLAPAKPGEVRKWKLTFAAERAFDPTVMTLEIEAGPPEPLAFLWRKADREPPAKGVPGVLRSQHERLLKLLASAVGPAPRLPSPADPAYHRQLAEQLDDDGALRQQAALRLLLETPPAEIADRAVFQQIARAFLRLAFVEGPLRAEAVRGMARYGGKHSVERLLKLLADPDPSLYPEVFRCLAEVGDPRGAEAVVTYLEDEDLVDEATDCLLRFGPAAEPAVRGVIFSEDAGLSVLGLKILGKIGTPESYPALKKVVRDGVNSQKKAAREARREIAARETFRKTSAATGKNRAR